MVTLKIRYLTSRPSRDGKRRYFWQPTRALREHGRRLTRLPDDYPAAMAMAERLNAEVYSWRKDGSVTNAASTSRGAAPLAGLYVIGSLAGPVKIGISSDPIRRLRDLQTARHEQLRLYFYLAAEDIPAPALEARVHAGLSVQRLHGEWFDCSPDAAIHAAMRASHEFRGLSSEP